MKVIIAGSRTIIHYPTVEKAIRDSGWKDEITEVVCGLSKGVDTLGATWASWEGVLIKYFYASWATYGKAAGPIRNEQMAEYADAAIVVWDGRSKGSADLIWRIQAKGKPIFIWRVDQ